MKHKTTSPLTTKILFFFLLFPLHLFGQTDFIAPWMLPSNGSPNYVPFENVPLASGRICKGNTASPDGYIHLSPKPVQESGIIITNKTLAPLKEILVKWKESEPNGAKLHIYGKNTEFDYSADDLFDDTKCGSLIGIIGEGDANPCYINTNKSYNYIGIRAEGGTAYLTKIYLGWNKSIQLLSFNTAEYFHGEGQTPKLQGAHTTVTYTSSDPSVATVDKDSGKVTYKGTGTTAITATAAETEDYNSATQFYYYIALPNTPHTVTFDFTNPESLSLQYKPGQDINNNLSFRSGDVTLTMKDGTSHTQLKEENGVTYMDLASTGAAVLKVPFGFKIRKFKLVNSKNGVTEDTSNLYEHELHAKNGFKFKSITVTYYGDYKFKMNSTGYATFSGAQAYTLPEGLQGATITTTTASDGTNTAKALFRVQPGDVVGAGTPLLLKGNPGEYTLRTTSDAGITFQPEENSLRPALDNNPIAAPSGHQLFIFANSHQGLGFYWQFGSTGGNTLKNIQNKAYLSVPVPAGTQSAGFKLDLGETTGITSPGTAPDNASLIYTLAGTPVHTPKEQLPKGIYLIRGKKIMIQ